MKTTVEVRMLVDDEWVDETFEAEEDTLGHLFELVPQTASPARLWRMINGAPGSPPLPTCAPAGA